MTVAFVWSGQPGPNERVEWWLVDPNGLMYPTQQGAKYFRYVTANLVSPVNLDDSVDFAWPSGNYHLRAEVWRDDLLVAVDETEPLITLTNYRPRVLKPPSIPVPLDVNFAGQIKLLGYHLPVRSLSQGQGIPITLYWQGLREMDNSFTVFAKLLDDNQEDVWGNLERLPADGYPTSQWWNKEVVLDGFELPVEPTVPPGIYWINVGLYLPLNESSASLPLVYDGQPSDITSVTFGPIKVGEPSSELVVPPEEAIPQVPLAIKLGDPPVIMLRGYDLSRSGDEIRLTLYWEGISPTPVDWSIFAHLRNQDGEIVAQKDGLAGATGSTTYPTALWDAEEIIADELTIPLPPDLPSGEYSMVIGLYNLTDGTRLSIPNAPNNEITLTTQKLAQP